MNNMVLMAQNAFLFLATDGTAFDPKVVTGHKTGTAFDSIADSVKAGGNSIIYILLLAAALIGAVGLIIAFIQIMAGGSNTKSNAKGNLLWIIVAIVGAAASVGSISALFAIGQGLFGGGSSTAAAGIIMPMLHSYF